MDFVIEFNPAAFDHKVSEADIYRAFDTAIYDGLLDLMFSMQCHAGVSITIC